MARKSPPLVSIGIPTYNRASTLKKTLDSLVCQTYDNIEIIVSDNCSPNDETEKVVRSFSDRDNRVKYYKQEENLGLYYNFKFVFDVSKGDYFTWTADDDSRSEKYIEACMTVFEELDDSSQVILVNSFSSLLDKQSDEIIKVDRGCNTVGLQPAKRYYKYLKSIYTSQASVGDLIYGVIRRKSAQEAFDTQPNILSWDHIFLANLALKGEFYTIPEKLMDSAPGGASSAKDVDKMARVQLIENQFFIKRARWARMLFLQKLVHSSNKLSPIDKLILIVWVFYDTAFRLVTQKIPSKQ